MHGKLHQLLILSMVAISLPSFDAQAEWGNAGTPKALLSSEKELALVKTARTQDGKTFLTWLEFNDYNSDCNDKSGYNVFMQLVDANGDTLWDNPLMVEDMPNASWTADYSLVATPEGDAIISWADARNEEGEEYPQSHIPVLYKINQKGEHLWGSSGVELGEKYKFPPILYQFGEDTYCVMESADDYGIPQITRLNNDGTFAFEPKDITGQFINSENTDIINIFSKNGATMAMRYTRDLTPVWKEETKISQYTYSGYARNHYDLQSDGHGGVVVSFSREFGPISHIPVVAYVTANGEAVFGESADVISVEDNSENDYNIIAVNTKEETILSTWQIYSEYDALGGQLMDYYGERLWGDDGIRLAEKDGSSGYSYTPIAAYPLEDNNWLVVYADEIYWMNWQLYYSVYDSDGQLINEQKSLNPVGISSISPYFVDNTLYLIFTNMATDDDWNTLYSVETVKITDFYASTKITDISQNTNEPLKYYNILGISQANPKPGLNIVRRADGTSHKIFIKH